MTAKDRIRREKDDNKKKGEFEAAKKKADKMAEKIAMYEKFTKSTLDDKRDILAKMMEGGQELIDLKTKAEDKEAKIEAQKSRIAKANKLVKSATIGVSKSRQKSSSKSKSAEADRRKVMEDFRKTVAQREKTFELLNEAHKEGLLPAGLTSRVFAQHEECEKYVEDEDALSAELLEVEKKILQHLRKSIERSSAAEFKSTVDGDSGAEKALPCSQWEMDKELEKTMLEANEYTAEATIARLNVLTEVYEKTAQVSCPSLFSP